MFFLGCLNYFFKGDTTEDIAKNSQMATLMECSVFSAVVLCDL